MNEYKMFPCFKPILTDFGRGTLWTGRRLIIKCIQAKKKTLHLGTVLSFQ